MSKCDSCGVYDEEAGICFKYRTIGSPGDKEDCYFYVETVWEDGERMTPQYYMILREIELKAKQMQGPV